MSETTSNNYFLSMKLLCIYEFYRAMIATIIFSIKMLHERLIVFFINLPIGYGQLEFAYNGISKCFFEINRYSILSAIYLNKILLADICMDNYLHKFDNFCTTQFVCFSKLIRKYNTKSLSIFKSLPHSFNSRIILKIRWFGNHLVRHVGLKCGFYSNHSQFDIPTTKSRNQFDSI